MVSLRKWLLFFGPKISVFGPKIRFLPYDPNFGQQTVGSPRRDRSFPTLIIWAKATFFFEQLFPVVARTWLEYKSVCLFLGPKFRFLAKKSDFCHTTPILVDDPFLALGMTVNFPPWEQFFDFPFRSYCCFHKKIWLTCQKAIVGEILLPISSLCPHFLPSRMTGYNN